jgi:hypothetical protein
MDRATSGLDRGHAVSLEGSPKIGNTLWCSRFSEVEGQGSVSLSYFVDSAVGRRTREPDIIAIQRTCLIGRWHTSNTTRRRYMLQAPVAAFAARRQDLKQLSCEASAVARTCRVPCQAREGIGVRHLDKNGLVPRWWGQFEESVWPQRCPEQRPSLVEETDLENGSISENGKKSGRRSPPRKRECTN